jgi:hypothetical protein
MIDDWGFMDAQDEGRLGALIEGPGLKKPQSAAVTDGWLSVTFDISNPGDIVRPGKRFLHDFLELAAVKPATEDTAAIGRFAARFGVLGLCPEHGLPVTHEPWLTRSARPCRMRGRVRGGQAALVREKVEVVFQEKVEHWIRQARIARAIVNIVERLNTDRPLKIEEFKLLPGWTQVRNGMPPHIRALADQIPPNPRANLAMVIDHHWLRMCRLKLGFNITSNGRPVPMFYGTPALLVQLGLQLVFTLSDIRALAMCSVCGKPYQPRRSPNPNRNNYCLRCEPVGRRANNRAAQRRRKNPPTLGSSR